MARMLAAMRVRRLGWQCCPSISRSRSRPRSLSASWQQPEPEVATVSTESKKPGGCCSTGFRMRMPAPVRLADLPGLRLIDHHRDVLHVHKVEVDPRHIFLRDIDAAVRATVERGGVIVRQVRQWAELIAPPGVVNFQPIVVVVDAELNGRRLIVVGRAWRIRRDHQLVLYRMRGAVDAWSRREVGSARRQIDRLN